ncbi:MAG: bacillithiol biosynthesis cysteine-adding enzyme BshC [Bacteroidetes bacterium]|nr:bacillithiol biosynthesis cysteine-adding enzyme BshC [Bacteroidota bacterium]
MKDAECMPYRETGYFSNLILDYLDEKDELKEFVSDFPSLDAFKNRIKARESFSQSHRFNLQSSFKAQYEEAGIKLNAALEDNLDLLSRADTFTVTTGHQLNILSGPLYFIYKIVGAINLAKRLKSAYPDKNFLPVYWMASEDHDFEEISFINLFGGKLKWQNSLNGAVGPMPTFGMGKVIDELESHLGPGNKAAEIIQIFRDAYHEQPDLSKATRYFVHQLFKDEGLLILDANRAELKKAMIPHFKKDLIEHSLHREVENQSESLQKNYFAQVHPRPINLFYLMPGIRERIEKVDGKWKVLNTSFEFNEAELLAELEKHPERFSPNVVLRPLYQEVILPNLAYIGGGGELAYWFQLKAMFDLQDVPFPILMLRNSVLLYAEKWANRLQDLHLEPRDLFQNLDDLKANYLKQRFPEDADLNRFDAIIDSMFSDLEKIAELTDESMMGAVNAQRQKQLNGIENLRKKLIRSEKRKHKELMEKLERVHEALFPKGSLQERHDNLSQYYADYGPQLIQSLLDALDPLDFRFSLLRL